MARNFFRILIKNTKRQNGEKTTMEVKSSPIAFRGLIKFPPKTPEKLLTKIRALDPKVETLNKEGVSFFLEGNAEGKAVKLAQKAGVSFEHLPEMTFREHLRIPLADTFTKTAS